MGDQLMMALYAIGGIALMPFAAVIIGGIRSSRRERRRQAMLARHAESLWQ